MLLSGRGDAWLDHRPPESVSRRSLCAQSSFGIRSEGEEGLLEEVAVELGPKRGVRASRREARAVSAGSQDAGAPGWGWRRVLEELGSQHSEFLSTLISKPLFCPKDLSSMNSTCSLPLLYSRP